MPRVVLRAIQEERRSCTVATNGAREGGTTYPASCTTSTCPVRRSTRGPRELPGLVQDLAGEGEPTDRDGRNEPGAGCRRCHAETPTRSNPSRDDDRSSSTVATAIPPGTTCQDCSTVTATRMPDVLAARSRCVSFTGSTVGTLATRRRDRFLSGRSPGRTRRFRCAFPSSTSSIPPTSPRRRSRRIGGGAPGIDGR